MRSFRITVFLILLISGIASFSQIAINTNGNPPDASAILDVSSTTKGILPPRMTNDQKISIPSPAAGLMVYCNDCNYGSGEIDIYKAAGWHQGGTPSPVYLTTCGTLLEYYPVSTAGYTWLDRNLGAGRVANSVTDYMAYGSLYQWGRQSDGHECITWTSSTTGTPVNGWTNTKCTNGTCPNGLFVLNGGNMADWNTPSSGILWSGFNKGTNDPCPAGYRVPSAPEISVLKSFVTATYGGNRLGYFASPLKMPTPGYHDPWDWQLYNTGVSGAYWTSTYTSDPTHLRGILLSYYDTGNVNCVIYGFLPTGGPVRCIAQ
jgi:hypothetical protein